MILRVYMLRPDWMDSERVNALPSHIQNFFLRLPHACDGAHRFENDAQLLRSALYSRLLDKVSERDVRSYIVRLHEATLIKLYSVRGKGYGEVLNMRQLDSNRAVFYPPETPDGELDLAGCDPPLGSNELKGSKWKGSAHARSAKHTPPPLAAPIEEQDTWIARLKQTWPNIDIEEQLTFALNKRRKLGLSLEREWFESKWLPKCSRSVIDPKAAAERARAAAKQADESRAKEAASAERDHASKGSEFSAIWNASNREPLGTANEQRAVLTHQ